MSIHRFVLHNGVLVDSASRLLALGQVGALSGWGVFSTLRVIEGVPFALERHFERMRRDASNLRVPFPETPEVLRAGLLRLIEANDAREAALRLAVIRNRGGLWEGPSDREFDVVAMTASPKAWGEGVRLALEPQARHAGSRFRGAKILSWATNLALLEEAQCHGFDEVLLLNELGEVSECTSANIFVAAEGRVWTPPLTSGCLPGVTRELLLEKFGSGQNPVGEKALLPEELFAADEVFITSTTRNLLPVISLDGRSLGRSHAVRDRLEHAFEAYIRQYISDHRPGQAHAAPDGPPPTGPNPGPR